MKKGIMICGIIVGLAMSACEMPQVWTMEQCRTKALRMFNDRYPGNAKVTVMSKREDDGYEFNIMKGQVQGEIDCGWYGFCEWDD